MKPYEVLLIAMAPVLADHLADTFFLVLEYYLG